MVTGKFIPTRRTPGVSTSELLERIVSGYRKKEFDQKLEKVRCVPNVDLLFIPLIFAGTDGQVLAQGSGERLRRQSQPVIRRTILSIPRISDSARTVRLSVILVQ